MIVECRGGLANRLRVLLSYRAAGVRQFAWRTDGEIANAHFLEVFEPLDGVEWAATGAERATCDPCPGAPQGWQLHYEDLRLDGAARVSYILGRPVVREYGAMHVRRTDHVQYAESCNACTTDAEFSAWLATAPATVYLATDNGTSQARWSGAIREHRRAPVVLRPIETNPYENNGGRRNTTLIHAAVDLFVCAGATDFKGSGASSFTDTIDLLRRMGGWWS